MEEGWQSTPWTPLGPCPSPLPGLAMASLLNPSRPEALALPIKCWEYRWGPGGPVGPLKTEVEHFSSPFFCRLLWVPALLCNTEWRTKQVKDINILLEIRKGVQNTKNNQFGENMGLKNKPNRKIKTVLTQKNEFILEASNFRFNCVDLSFFSPVPFSTVCCWKRLRAARALIYLVWQKTPMLPEKTHS